MSSSRAVETDRSGPGPYRITIVEGDDARDVVRLADACARIFPDSDPAYLTGRLGAVSDPALVAAHRDDRIVAFKLGYRRGASLFYSWLGGVDPTARRLGLARRLMEAQHEWAASAGYGYIETRTRALNVAMIMLNLQHGFIINGFETDAAGLAVITQRKRLC